MHLSDVIHDMDRELMGTEEHVVTDLAMLLFEKGYLWEVALSRAFGEKGPRKIGEIELDGIIMTPDSVCGAGFQELIVEEYKCTACSSTKSPTDNWRWMMQVKGYCKALGASKCIFRILYHVDIMRRPDSAYGVFLLTFTQGELDENWEAVVNHARTMKERDDD